MAEIIEVLYLVVEPTIDICLKYYKQPTDLEIIYLVYS